MDSSNSTDGLPSPQETTSPTAIPNANVLPSPQPLRPPQHHPKLGSQETKSNGDSVSATMNPMALPLIQTNALGVQANAAFLGLPPASAPSIQFQSNQLTQPFQLLLGHPGLQHLLQAQPQAQPQSLNQPQQQQQLGIYNQSIVSSQRPLDAAFVQRVQTESILSSPRTLGASSAHLREQEEPLLSQISQTGLVKRSFPERVYWMLESIENTSHESVISFVANGTAFMIHNPSLFETDVMPLFFSSRRMSSFQRNLNLYQFKRIEEKGITKGAYQHPCFLKGKPHLLHKIQRRRVKKGN